MSKTTYFLDKKVADPRPLFENHNGETDESRQIRWDEFERNWQEQQQSMDKLLEVTKIDRVVEFVNENFDTDRIPTALLLSGPDIASHTRIFQQLRAGLDDELVMFVSINSHDCSKLNATLKRICLAVGGGNDLDLDALLHCEGKKIAILIEDAASFDGAVMAQMIKLLHSYMDRVQIRLLFNVATSVQVFESKLPQWCIRLLKGVEFQAEQSSILDMLGSSLARLPISPEVFDFLVSLEGTNAFLSALKYCYMTHYYSKSISSVRRYASFQKHVESLTDMQEVEQLLTNDTRLQQEVDAAREEFQKYMERVGSFIEAAKFLHSCLGEEISRATLYRKAVCGEILANEFASRVDEFEPEMVQSAAIYLEVEFEDTGISSRRQFLTQLIESYTIPPCHSVYLHEHFMFDNASILKQAFQPSIRSAVETTLAEPQIPVHLSALYQLYRESPVTINTYDLYTAFHEITNAEDEADSLAWFLQGIAELKMLGFIKDVRRQYESVGKLLWKDL